LHDIVQAADAGNHQAEHNNRDHKLNKRKAFVFPVAIATWARALPLSSCHLTTNYKTA